MMIIESIDMAKTVKSKNISKQAGFISPRQRRVLLGQRGCVVWLTGLSGSGKSTIARALEKRLIENGRASYVLDGDNVRFGLNSDLGFSREDRDENIRRVGEVSALMADAGLIVLVAFISPYRAARKKVRAMAKKNDTPFFEIFLDVDIDTCQQRDPKGLYKKAALGKIKEFTGLDSPYQKPTKPEIVLKAGIDNLGQCVEKIFKYLKRKKVFK